MRSRKVRAAKTRVPISDGGTHPIDCGVATVGNYEITSEDSERHEVIVDKHHFK